MTALVQPPESSPPSLVLASTSRYRAELLSRLGQPFAQRAPDTDESERRGEAAGRRALRLAGDKALQVLANHGAPCTVIGSDQVCALEGQVLRKPGSRQRQAEQLQRLSGHEACFHTAVAVASPDGQLGSALVTTWVRFRTLDSASIERYCQSEPAQDCAGGFKVEGLGISLFDSVRSDDPTALIGLPLIALCTLLRPLGWQLP